MNNRKWLGHSLWAIMFLWTAGFVTSAQGQEPAPDLEAPLLEWTNQYRQMYGRSALTPDPKLTEAARKYAAKMAQHDQAAYGLDGKTVFSRARDAGYDFYAIGENVAYAQPHDKTAWKLFEAWMLSAPHWQKIQARDCTDIGVAVYRGKSGRYYACQVFGSRSQPKPAAVATPPPYSGYTGFPTGLKRPTNYPNPAPQEGFNLGIGTLPPAPALPENYFTPQQFTPYYGW